MNTKPSTFDHIKSIIQLPFVVTVLVPIAIYFFTNQNSIIPFDKINDGLSHFIGGLILALGIALFIMSINLFIKIGNGTLAPWNPTRKMIIHGLYRYVRNPMLIGVNLILLAESLILQSGNIFLWMIFFVVINTIYFIKSEEPELVKKFGDEYIEYCKHVPRWIPRLTPYQP